MLLSPDRTGFPLIVVPEVELEVHLLPVTKLQFEQFITDSGRLDIALYQELAMLNPQIALPELTLNNRERLFISGVQHWEAQAFAEWQGDGFDLPTAEEWRGIYRALRRERFPETDRLLEWTGEPVASILRILFEQFPARRLLDISLMRGGLVEWVRTGEDWIGLGSPRPAFHPNLWDPIKNLIRPLAPDKRLHYFGFRLVRRGQWDVANKPGGIYLF
jgi:formylglycine-generating enzyme required for sulfatase activity